MKYKCHDVIPFCEIPYVALLNVLNVCKRLHQMENVYLFSSLQLDGDQELWYHVKKKIKVDHMRTLLEGLSDNVSTDL